MSQPHARRALISVYDKTGLVDFARALHEELGFEILSTGGTARHLTDAGIPVTLVEDVTGFPEMLDGRVKTLHPRIHAAILADRDNPEHMRQLAEQGIRPIDLVVVNLYPFEDTVARPDCTLEQAIEMIDIGGPCLLRAAAKNSRHVRVVCGPGEYEGVLESLRSATAVQESLRLQLASRAFQQTCRYDAAIATWLTAHPQNPDEPEFRAIHLRSRDVLRYGENPHQQAEVCSLLGWTEWLTGKTGGPALSYNNLVDAGAALELCAELTRAAGVASASSVGPAFQPVSGPRRDVGPVFSVGLSSSVGPVSSVGPAFQPVSGPPAKTASARLESESHTERHLPHIQNPGATYFVTFRLKTGELASAEKDIVLGACRYWHTRKMTLHACVVMPDHVHLILTPHEISPGAWVSLGELLQSMKGYSSREINRARGVTGSLWLDENWDRIVRNEKEYEERWNYIENNPGKAGLGDAYPWLWLNPRAWEELGEHEGDRLDRLESRSHKEDRLESRSHNESRSHTGSGSHRLGTAPAVACFIKHTNPCGVGVADEPVEAYRRAYLGDPNAAMGGILAVNVCVDAAFAEAVMGSLQRWGKAAGAGAFFLEVWLAPSFQDDAVQVIRTRKPWGARVRLIDVGDGMSRTGWPEHVIRSIPGDLLIQSCDTVGLNESEWRVVTDRAPDERELADLRLAWLVCKHTKSNAISICRYGILIGNGAGQMSRVMSCRIATWAARENGHTARAAPATQGTEGRRDEGTEGRRDGGTEGRRDGGTEEGLGPVRAGEFTREAENSDVCRAGALAGAVAASDAFFPFRDGPDILMDAGVTAIIQPGGSKRDEEVIRACNERRAAMIFTGTRHFRH